VVAVDVLYQRAGLVPLHVPRRHDVRGRPPIPISAAGSCPTFAKDRIMNVTKHLTKFVGLAALGAAVIGFAGAAQASPVPPKASTALLGTWINTNAASRSVTQIVITPNRIGNVSVDAFGACVPSLCEWGRVPATVYGTSVSAASGLSFQTNQRFLSGSTEFERTTLLGTVGKTRLGLQLTVRELTVFTDGSGRKNMTVTETFRRGDGQAPTHTGLSVSAYRAGNPPTVAGALGKWVNPTPTGGLVAIVVGGTAAHPIVEGFGQCSPTPCDFGRTRAINYGPSVSSARGNTLLAPYNFGFKKTQLVITYSRTVRGERLTVAEYNEFTDGSGRSNYLKTETLVRA
jgi:hypothetical protein